MSAGSILEESAELSYLAKHASPTGSPPPSDTSLDIWAYSASQILPGTLQFHTDNLPQKSHNSRSFQILAKAARISNHTIANAKNPSKEIWQHQMTELGSYLEFRQKFRQENHEYITQYASLKQRRQSINEKIDTIDREWEDLDIETIRSQYQHNNQLVDDLSQSIALASRLREDLNGQFAHFSTRLEELHQNVETLNQQTAVTSNHINLMRLLADDGWTHIKSTTLSLKNDIHNLMSRQSRQQAILEQYKYTMHVFEELAQTLQMLLRIENEVISRKDERNNIEITHSRPLRQKFSQLSRQVSYTAHEVEKLKSQIRELRETITLLEQESEKETEHDPLNNSNQNLEVLPGVDKTKLQLAEKDLDDLRTSERDLNSLIHTQRKWLHGMKEVERFGRALIEENKKIKDWMNQYLDRGLE